MSTVPEIFDHVGKPITIGCFVAYPHRQRSKLWIEVMEVVNIRYYRNNVLVTGKTINGRRKWTKNINNCVVINPPNNWNLK